MEKSEKKIPIYVLEDRLFARRLHRNLNDELERLHHLLTEQVRLLKERDALMSKVHAAVQQRWEKEEAESVILQTELTEEEPNHE
jgi:hypothetical protein